MLNKFTLGCSSIYNQYGIKKTGIFDEIELRKILKILQKLKINKFDTASSYGKNFEFIKLIDKKYNPIITTKISDNTRKYKNKIDNLKLDLEKVIESLPNYKIENLLLHNENDLFRKKYSDDLFKFLESNKGNTIQNIGISMYSLKKTLFILRNYNIGVIQFPINILDQTFNSSSFKKIILEKKIKTQARSIFLQGLLLKNYDSINKNLKCNQLKLFMEKTPYIKERINYIWNFISNMDFINEIVIGIKSLEQLEFIIKSIKMKSTNKLSYDLDISKFRNEDTSIIDPRNWNLNF